jgi:hypothetical protein
MSATSLVRAAAAGILLVNAIPHGVAAVSGRDFPSPFAQPPGVGMSPPRLNAGWASANILGAAALLPRGPLARAERWALVGGGVAMSFVLANWFGKVMQDAASA